MSNGRRSDMKTEARQPRGLMHNFIDDAKATTRSLDPFSSLFQASYWSGVVVHLEENERLPHHKFNSNCHYL